MNAKHGGAATLFCFPLLSQFKSSQAGLPQKKPARVIARAQSLQSSCFPSGVTRTYPICGRNWTRSNDVARLSDKVLNSTILHGGRVAEASSGCQWYLPAPHRPTPFGLRRNVAVGGGGAEVGGEEGRASGAGAPSSGAARRGIEGGCGRRRGRGLKGRDEEPQMLML